MKILLLAGNPLFNETIKDYLLIMKHETTCVLDKNTAEKFLSKERFDLLIFDVNIPKSTNFDFVHIMREDCINIPIIFITSQHSVTDIHKGSKLKYNDFLKKPFKLRDLGIRIENIMKLYNINSHRTFKINDFISYSYKHNLVINNNREFTLSQKEAKILEYFIKNKNKALSIDEISFNNWGSDKIPKATTIRTYIKKLRRKLNYDSILTLKGMGYRLIIKS